MKIFKIAVVVLLFLVNLMVAQPSWADKKLTESPDYIEVTQALDTILKQKETEGATVENVEKIADLKFQKYILETGENLGQCRNETGTAILVYGQKPKKSYSTSDNALYLLPSGQETDDEWDCDGVYLPSDVKVAGIDPVDGQQSRGAVAYKIVDGTRLIAKTNPVTSEIEFNVPPAKVFPAGDQTNWFIPDTLQAALDTGITKAPIDD
ncbi:MAG: hypothetical protein DSM106950_10615 [Stigonema ocellatum SAG 48.90 = DSM 106950]|nr:hypothetical protein [Stigonema ocellatum SAG 48.90 = DSM 106950]